MHRCEVRRCRVRPQKRKGRFLLCPGAGNGGAQQGILRVGTHRVPSSLLGTEAPSAPMGLADRELCFPCRVSPSSRNICTAHKREHNEPCPSVPHPCCMQKSSQQLPSSASSCPAQGELSTVRCPGPWAQGQGGDCCGDANGHGTVSSSTHSAHPSPLGESSTGSCPGGEIWAAWSTKPPH